MQEGRALYETLRIGGIDVRVHTTITRRTFETCITQITQEVSTGDHVPILHISAHGNADCVEFSNGETLDWKSLGDILAPLNKALGGYLLVCMSTCFGSSALKMARRLNAQTYNTLIGPKGAVAWHDALIAYTSFYHNFICKRIDIPSAVKAMAIAAGIGNDIFEIASGEDAHKEFMKEVLAHLGIRSPKMPNA